MILYFVFAVMAIALLGMLIDLFLELVWIAGENIIPERGLVRGRK